MASTLPLLLHTLTTVSLIISTILQTTYSSQQKQHYPLILPLKQQTQPPSNSGKLSFHHNVTLTVTLTVGTPPQNVTMVLDTGSELSWLHCNNNNTFNNFFFNPSLSSSYVPTPCNSSICKTRTRDLTIPPSCDPTTNKLCHVIVSYADSTSTEGTLSADTFSMGPTPQPNTLFGCMETTFTTNPNEDSRTTGLLGMNQGSLSFVTQLGLPKFSYCISVGEGSSGVLLFGATTTAAFPWLGPLQYTPLVKSTTTLPYFDRVAYTVQLEGIKVSEKLLQLPKSVFVPDHTGAGQTMVDSGTQFTFLLGSVYTALKNEFLNQTKGNSLLKVVEDPNFVFQGAMDLCYSVVGGGGGSVAGAVPAVTMVFTGAEMRVSGERLLYKVNETVYCFTFGNSDLLGIEAYVIGHHHQQNVWMEFDLVNSRVGFADTKCDLASQRLRP
ncbi:Glutathione gamma-glutamylcysteinyltransferase 1 [Stylosanthes scabra]|uniref:Glutathione gamma-glutamylcysteinyltransferase 1 n=1 Tax=Stylosanthes scabra TaxID=79078 RepID=A0ABU6WR34_9FABA|nr:Glutathione gamma-glutamylcysteinyltransferase 1 [Stylosanthes scabra]